MTTRKAEQPAVGGRLDEIHDRLGKLTTELVQHRRAGNWHRYGRALAETKALLDDLDGGGAAAAESREASDEDGARSCPAPGSGTPLELERHVERTKSSGLVGVGGVLQSVVIGWEAEAEALAELAEADDSLTESQRAEKEEACRTYHICADELRRVGWDTHQTAIDLVLLEIYEEVERMPTHYSCGAVKRVIARFMSEKLKREEDIPVHATSDEINSEVAKLKAQLEECRATRNDAIQALVGGGGAEPVGDDVCEKPKSPNDGAERQSRAPKTP